MNSPRGAELVEHDRSRLLGSVSVALFGQGGAFVFGMLCMILTTRLLGPEGYGALSKFFLVLAILSQVVVSWPNLGLVRFGREELAERGVVARSFWARAAIFPVTLLAAAALLWIFRGQLEARMGMGFAPFLVLAAYLGLNEAIFLCRAAFQTASRFRDYAVSNTLVKLCIFLGLAILYLWSRAPERTVGAADVLNVHLCGMGIALAVCVMLLPWRLLRPLQVNAAQAAAIVRYSWPLMLGGLSVFVVDWVDQAVIWSFCSEADLGVYAVSYQAVTVLSQLRMAGVSALLPLLISMAIEKRHETLTWFLDDALPQAAWAIGLACTLAAGLAELIPAALGERFAPSVVPAQVLMAGVAFSMLAAVQTALAQALDRVRATAAVVMLLALLNVGGDLLLVPVAGILGAAIATSAAFAVSGLFYFPILNGIATVRGGAPGRRYLALAAFLPNLLFAVLAISLKSPSLRVIACAALLLVSLAAAKMLGVFKRSTLERLDKIHMHDRARSALRKFYSVMGA